MIVTSDRTIELNQIEIVAAVAVKFPFNQFTTKRIGYNSSHLRVTFYSAAQCDMWKRKIMNAVPADAPTA